MLFNRINRLTDIDGVASLVTTDYSYAVASFINIFKLK